MTLQNEDGATFTAIIDKRTPRLFFRVIIHGEVGGGGRKEIYRDSAESVGDAAQMVRTMADRKGFPHHTIRWEGNWRE